MNFAVIFSGQGLQSTKHIAEIKHNAAQYGLTTELATLFAQLESAESEQNAIFSNQLAQPFIFSLQYLRWLQVKAHLPQPEFLAGYSLGEANAFCCSSTLSFNQSFELITVRADLMTEQVQHTACSMAAIQGLNLQQLLPLLQSPATQISIKLNEIHYIIVGTTQAVEQLIAAAKAQGAQHINKLKVSVPSHSSFLDNAAEKFSAYLNTLPHSQMQFPIISASAGQKYFTHAQATEILSQQINHALDWQNCMETLKEYQADVILEIGPGNALSKMIAEVMPNIHVRSIDDFNHFDGVVQWLSRFE